MLKKHNIWVPSVYNFYFVLFCFSDGIIRIFTKHADRVGDPVTLAAYQEQVASFSAGASQDVGGVKLSE